MENEQETVDSTNNTEETVNDEITEETVETEPEGESVEELKKQIATLNAQKEHWREKAGKVKPSEVETKQSGNLSTKDTMALIEAKVSSEDFDEVVDFANYRKISVVEALKSSTLKAILAEKAEFRATQNATQTRSPRSTTKVTGEVLVQKAKQGQLPEKQEDIEALVRAEMEAKVKKD